MVHPTWEGDILWIATGPHTAKAREIQKNGAVDIQFQVAPGTIPPVLVTAVSLVAGIDQFAQLLVLVGVSLRIPLFDRTNELKLALAQAEAAIQPEGGRVLLRYSGTEPKIRLLLEGRDAAVLDDLAVCVRAVVQHHVAVTVRRRDHLAHAVDADDRAAMDAGEARPDAASQGPRQRGLTAAAGTADDEEAACGHVERQVVEGDGAAGECLANVV